MAATILNSPQTVEIGVTPQRRLAALARNRSCTAERCQTVAGGRRRATAGVEKMDSRTPEGCHNRFASSPITPRPARRSPAPHPTPCRTRFCERRDVRDRGPARVAEPALSHVRKGFRRADILVRSPGTTCPPILTVGRRRRRGAAKDSSPGQASRRRAQPGVKEGEKALRPARRSPARPWTLRQTKFCERHDGRPRAGGGEGGEGG